MSGLAESLTIEVTAELIQGGCPVRGTRHSSNSMPKRDSVVTVESGRRPLHTGAQREFGSPIKMLLGARRPVSTPGHTRGRREQRVRADRLSIPIGATVKTRLSAVQTDRSLQSCFHFEFLTQSGCFWLPPGSESEEKVRKVTRPNTEIDRFEPPGFIPRGLLDIFPPGPGNILRILSSIQ